MAERQPVLVLAPHPDDETLGCGGTIKLLTQAGIAVDVLYCTRGELGFEAPEATTVASRQQLADVRTAEARAACAVLGVRQVDFLNGRDGSLAEQGHLARDLGDRLRAGGFDRVFCPWPQDRHPDHQAAFACLRTALASQSRLPHVWLYEVWTPLLPSLCVPIDAVIEAKLEAIRAHQSQLACLDYLMAFRGLASYRSLFCPGARFAEAFQVTEGAQLLKGS